jgi:hypothetical protein
MPAWFIRTAYPPRYIRHPQRRRLEAGWGLRPTIASRRARKVARPAHHQIGRQPRCLLLLSAGADFLDLDIGLAGGVADGLPALLGFPLELDLTDDAGFLLDLGLFLGPHHLDGLLLEGALGLILV